MINFLAQAHMTNKTWAFSNDLPVGKTMSQMVLDDMSEISVNVGFIDKESTVEFTDMSSSLQIFVNDLEICNIDYPQVPVERTNLPYCFSYVFRPMPGDEIVINVGVTNDGQTWNGSLDISIEPLPEPEPTTMQE
jgi:hypothetical protein